ncbi:MAG: response regulator transcription factor [Candidatus Aminicenantes bacterium]|nr:MAG: response regulator transcription factor [Candidatus Aminicenantes bacterium]
MKNKIRAIIVDDEALARESLKETISQFEDIEMISECANGFEAVQAVQQTKPDLIFLDIQMPKLDGFDVVELLGKEAPAIIFVTAYDEYALRAFEAEALDYLLKPVSNKRLQKSIERVRERLNSKVPQEMERFIDHHQENMAPLTRILIRDGMNIHIIPQEDIVFVEAKEDYVKFHTEERAYLKLERMSNLERKLDYRNFCRIHRSYLLNINYLVKIEPYSKDSRIAKLKNGKSLPISRSGYNRLMELI